MDFNRCRKEETSKSNRGGTDRCASDVMCTEIKTLKSIYRETGWHHSVLTANKSRIYANILKTIGKKLSCFWLLHFGYYLRLALAWQYFAGKDEWLLFIWIRCWSTAVTRIQIYRPCFWKLAMTIRIKSNTIYFSCALPSQDQNYNHHQSKSCFILLILFLQHQ